MLRFYALGRIGKYKRKQSDLKCGFVRPFRVMSKRIQQEKYVRSEGVSYL